MSWAYYWPFLLMIAGILLAILSHAIASLKQNAWVKSHAAAAHIADLADDICSAAITYLSNNPAMTPSQLASWALNELKATAPDLITSAGSLASSQALGYMVNRKLLTAAQAAPISEATSGVIAALAPSAVTARVSPTQIVAVKTAASGATSDVEAIAAALLAKFPGLKMLQAPSQTTSATVTSGGTAVTS